VGLHNTLSNLYDGSEIALADKNAGKLTFDRSKFQKAMAWLHKQGSFSPEMLKEQPARELISETNRILQHALQKGFQQGIKHDIPITQMRYFENDVFVFSGFKTYNQLKEASLLLNDENGVIKSFDKFKQDVLRIDKAYNKTYLEAEYNFAVSSAQMASKWLEMEADGDEYNLQYRTASDGRVREDHAILHDTTLPPSDPFWDKYYPPNGWNCRCTAVQVLKDKYPVSNSEEAQKCGDTATTKIGKNGKNNAAIFRFNPGKDKIIFPPTHPYRSPRCATCNVRKNLAAPINIERCNACVEILKLAKQRENEIRKETLSKMKHLLDVSIEKDVVINGQNKAIKVGFYHKGNKHLYNDMFIKCDGKLTREDLINFDKIVKKATNGVGPISLYKSRTDKIKDFVYFDVKVNGTDMQLQVGRRALKDSCGRRRIKYEAYCIRKK
jgi:SPP1 gp7 family putative phage head morphogenesis protein